MSDSRLLDGLYRWRVRGGTAGVLGVLVFARPAWTPLAAGIVISLAGLALRGWAAGHLQKEKELAVSGPYRYSRNPLYFGSVIIGAGFTLGAWSWIAAAILAAYFFIFYPVVILAERNRMRALFPDAYASYEKSVPIFFPAPRKRGRSERLPFSPALYRQNKEIRAVWGTALIWAVLAAKMLYL